MNLRQLSAAVVLFLPTAQSSLAQTPGSPLLNVETLGPQLTISWSEPANATGYTLYYAPYPAQTPIYSLDMGAGTGISGELSLGDAFYVAVEPRNGNGVGQLSNVEYFILAEPNLSLHKKSQFSFLSSNGYEELNLPYLCIPSNCSKQSNLTIIGGSSYAHGEFKLVAQGKSYRITSISATNLNGNVSAWIEGLEVGQLIKPNNDTLFTTKSSLTGGSTSVLQWSIEVENEGTIFTDTVNFRSN